MATQARTEFSSALNQIASEKGVDVKVVVQAIEQAALAAYRKDLSLRGQEVPEDFEELTARINPSSGEISIMRGEQNITPPGFARIAAQTAKQVIMQRLHEAEKGAIMDEYEQKVGTIITGTIQRQEGNTYFVDLGRAEGVLPPSEQTRDEYYHPTQRLKFFIKEIRETGRGPEVVVSRNDAGLVKGLFAMEVPEIQSGAVVIKDIAREAGGRTKLSAISTQEGVDPVGSLVGQKGVRVQTVITELGEEKIDIVPFSEDPARYIASALSPAKDVQVTLLETEGEKLAKVKIQNAQLSLAIGKGGQNVRLAAKLTGWRIDIEGLDAPEEAVAEVVPAEVKEEGTSEQEVQADAPVADDTQTPAQADAQAHDQADLAAVAESEDVATEPEPSEAEAAVAEGDAAADMAEEPTETENTETSQDESKDEA